MSQNSETPNHGRENKTPWSESYFAIRGGYKVLIVGIVALVVARVVQSLAWPQPSILSSQANVPLIQNIGFDIIGGIFFGFVIGFYFLRYYSKIPLASPVLKALVVSLLAVFVVNGLVTLLHLSDAPDYFLWGLAYSIPPYSVLGIALGYSYKRFNSEYSIKAMQAKPVKRRIRLYYYLILAAFMGMILVGGPLLNSLEPTSFTATNIHFESSTGFIHVIANITNPSQPDIIQVNAAINGMNDGICGYSFHTNATMSCNFFTPSDGVPLLGCGQLPFAENYTLTLNAYFSNMKTVINTYTVSRAQIGCPSFKL